MMNDGTSAMKASEIIKVLQAEIEKRGDLEVQLRGRYGADSDVFEILGDENISKEDRGKFIYVWTDIMTG